MGNNSHGSRNSGRSPSEGSQTPPNGTIEQGARGDDTTPRNVAEQTSVVRVAGGASQGRTDSTSADGDTYDVLRRLVKRGKAPWGHPDDPARYRFPKLMGFLTDKVINGVKSREVARLVINATPGGFTASLVDFTLSYKLTVRCDNLEEVFSHLELGIEGGIGEWTEVKQGEGYHKRREEERKLLEKRNLEI